MKIYVKMDDSFVVCIDAIFNHSEQAVYYNDKGLVLIEKGNYWLTMEEAGMAFNDYYKGVIEFHENAIKKITGTIEFHENAIKKIKEKISKGLVICSK